MHFLNTILFAASVIFASPTVVDVAKRSTTLERRNSCGAEGVVNGQCGEVYFGLDCTETVVHHIVPDCSQTCIQVTDRAIASVRAMGDGTYGTTCYLYEDLNCQQEIARTGQAITITDKKCATLPVGKFVQSWKCTFRC